MKVLVVDNYDSFVYNLAQYVGALGGEPVVVRNDRLDVAMVEEMAPDRIIVSPGPGHPGDGRSFGQSAEVIRRFGESVPTLGVCLGHQGIAHVFGAEVGRANRVMHGKTSRIVHDGKGVMEGIPSPIEATRYHSLVVKKEGLPDDLKVTALALDDAEVMGVRHSKFPIEGVQFHPESIMTRDGTRIIENFLDRGVRH